MSFYLDQRFKSRNVNGSRLYKLILKNLLERVSRSDYEGLYLVEKNNLIASKVPATDKILEKLIKTEDEESIAVAHAIAELAFKNYENFTT